MDGLHGGQPATWTIDDIPFRALDRGLIHDDRRLFYCLAAASFIEITSDLYTANLVEYYRDDDEVTDWLSLQWEPEEVRHGTALKRYVETAWPEFDWNAAYRGFFAEYSSCCALEAFAATRGLELAARCVVETGTSTFYRALSDMTDEPVLKRITGLIAADEVRHYKHFYRFYRRYHESEQPSRLAVAGTLWRRMAEVDAEDGRIAFKHVFLVARPESEFQLADYHDFRTGMRLLARRHYPFAMGVRMMLKPLELSPSMVRVVVPPVVFAARLLLLR